MQITNHLVKNNLLAPSQCNLSKQKQLYMTQKRVLLPPLRFSSAFVRVFSLSFFFFLPFFLIYIFFKLIFLIDR